MKKLWFRARDYGWGWYPATWEGGVVLGLWVLCLFLLVRYADPELYPVRWAAGLAASVAVLIAVCWRTGERPSWRWAGRPMPPRFVLVRVAAVVAVAFAVAATVSYFLR